MRSSRSPQRRRQVLTTGIGGSSPSASFLWVARAALKRGTPRKQVCAPCPGHDSVATALLHLYGEGAACDRRGVVLAGRPLPAVTQSPTPVAAPPDARQPSTLARCHGSFEQAHLRLRGSRVRLHVATDRSSKRICDCAATAKQSGWAAGWSALARHVSQNFVLAVATAAIAVGAPRDPVALSRASLPVASRRAPRGALRWPGRLRSCSRRGLACSSESQHRDRSAA